MTSTTVFVVGEQISSQWITTWTEFVKHILSTEQKISLKIKPTLYITSEDLENTDKVIFINTSTFFTPNDFDSLLKNEEENTIVSSVQVGNAANNIFAMKSKDDKTLITRETLKFFTDENNDSGEVYMKVFQSHFNFTSMSKTVCEYLVEKNFQNYNEIFSILQENSVVIKLDTSINTPVETKVII